ncbi:Uma2 family endonuclease [Leptolyngbya sp. NIES-2104]|uniref:Uma2 family endonuclease n=1 Tax=Leptolyngbya sp. NIES-2104 TaxID=1552121 RepID=UPI0006EC4B42|nr:Uma2 family endonuclease [Leptolyngbya sp. NIES-2104]GAP96323.1 protein of unknown function DUF820 [Leptolyngbya sp. NIES-2104]
MVAEIKSDIIYPESDGKPMADNTKQFEWIVLIKKNLDLLFQNEPNVFVAGDLLWYPVEGNPNVCAAPDAMVVFGRPKGDRSSYKQWEEANLPPQVVFEILSPSNTKREMARKLVFYEDYDVEEYYIYDPDANRVEGWLKCNGMLNEIDDFSSYTSPRLSIRFDLSASPMQIYCSNGRKFLSYGELDALLQQERSRADQAEQRAEQLAEQLRQMGIDPDQI